MAEASPTILPYSSLQVFDSITAKQPLLWQLLSYARRRIFILARSPPDTVEELLPIRLADSGSHWLPQRRQIQLDQYVKAFEGMCSRAYAWLYEGDSGHFTRWQAEHPRLPGCGV